MKPLLGLSRGALTSDASEFLTEVSSLRREQLASVQNIGLKASQQMVNEHQAHAAPGFAST